jgi:hypothetical protein
MNPTSDENITKTECELRCGAYVRDLDALRHSIEHLEGKCSDVLRWQAGHDGKINAYWEQQFNINGQVDQSLAGIFRRLGAVENKVIWASGFAACGGAVLGVVVSVLMTRLMGG